jgi:hypothetical protein
MSQDKHPQERFIAMEERKHLGVDVELDKGYFTAPTNRWEAL